MADPVLPVRPPGPHPTPEQLYSARRGPRTAEAERWLAHAAACALCSEELVHQEAFDAPEPVSAGRLAAAWERFKEGPSRAPRPPRRLAVPRSGLALAASLAVAVVGLSVWTATRPPQAPHAALRGGAEITDQAGAWQPAGPLDAPPAELVFPAADGEAQRVTVFDATHTYTWTSPPATGGRIPFPAAERQRLHRGVEYFWTVLGDEGAVARKFWLR
jgi:hypothetical protein